VIHNERGIEPYKGGELPINEASLHGEITWHDGDWPRLRGAAKENVNSLDEKRARTAWMWAMKNQPAAVEDMSSS